MKKRIDLPTFLIVFGLFALTGPLFGSNKPENPYSIEYVLADAPAEPVAQPKAEQTVLIVPPLAPRYVTVPQDTIPLEDRTGDFLSSPSFNPFDLKDPATVTKSVEYDPITNQYIITERIGEDFYRPQSYMTFDEYLDYQSKKQEQDYFNELNAAGGRSASGRIDPVTKIDVKNQLIERLFGGTKVDIQPQGNIDLTFGADYSEVENPSLPRRQQRRGGFDFDMDIQMNVEGSIGEKLKLSTNYNTQATFDFDNTMKLDYNTDAFGEDDILKKIEAGNVSLPLKGTLIQGSQSLFGLKTELQFAKLKLSLIASQQRSEQENITLKGGSQLQQYQVFADAYDENRHFLLTHYNFNNFEEALENLPVIKSLFKIQRIQVWVTNDRNETNNARDIVAISDLGETTRMTNTTPAMQPPSTPLYTDNSGEALPENHANPIYPTILSDPRTKQVERVVTVLKNAPFNLQQGRDFEKVSARLLSPTEFTFHPQLGFISLNTNIQPDQVVGVAFEYTYKDKVYQVGQMAEDVAQNSGISDRDTTQTSVPIQSVLFVKMLKSTVQPVNLPTWDLMMKNVYNIGAYNVAAQDFKLDIFYDDPGFGKKRFLPTSNIAQIPLINVFNLDQLNVQNDPQPDGVFDFVEGLTIQTRSGRIMFPVLEPFGSALEKQITDPVQRKKYVYNQLYDLTLFNAREFPELNRFTIEGSYKSSVSNEISLGAFNIPPGSVRVTAGGQQLVEGRDYEVDYSIGKVRILNDAILNSGAPVQVGFEDNTLFGFQQKAMLGMRADYEVNKHLTIGGTYLRLFERPFTQKVNIGDDPINNRMFGLDMNYSNEVPWVTRMVDKLPFISTKAPSNLTFSAETAAIKPGHARAINENSEDDDKGGVVYIDDFEGSSLPIPLNTRVIGNNGWVLASVPNNEMFPESAFKDTTLAGVNRAHTSWYRIDFTDASLTSDGDRNNPYAQIINQVEIFPNFRPPNQLGGTGAAFAQILDVQYDPTRRGSYNFDLPNGGTAFSAGLNNNGRLNAPETRWGGIMSELTTNDFQTANVEFLEFWMLSPYLDTTGAVGANPNAINGNMDGHIYFNFGNISEDILPDSRKMFENGLPGPATQGRRAIETGWGMVPLTQQITAAFDTNKDNRPAQDVGLDGLPNVPLPSDPNALSEQTKFKPYLDAINSSPDILQEVKDVINADPSNDDFVHFRRGWPDGTSLIQRYDRFFGTENNTPINDGADRFATGSTTLPDAEDINRDFTLNETEGYFQYRVPIQHDGNGGIRRENNPFITDVVQGEGNRIWYRFRVPLELPDDDENFSRIGGIQDFRSIRFMRMYFKDFEAPVHFRFATLELQRNQWRRYKQDLGEACLAQDAVSPEFELNRVNIEQNARREPFNYVLPPGISREQSLGVNLQALQNEQAVTMRVCDLADGDGRGMFKNLNLDMRFFTKMKMFVHAEPTICDVTEDPIDNGDLSVFVRFGSDFKNNYYEYEIPLTLSDPDDPTPRNDDQYQRVVWPRANDISIDFKKLIELKIDRNNSSVPVGQVFSTTEERDEGGDAIYKIKGAPNLGNVKALMIGIRNPKQGIDCDPNDEKSVEIWVNELRVFGLDEKGGVAATARADIQLADLGNLSLAGKFSGYDFGALDQQLLERSRERITQYDVATQLSLDKFLPSDLGLKLPFYFQISNEVRTPKFNPYDLDILLKDSDDSIRNIANTSTKIKSYNFTNVRWDKQNPSGKVMPWSLSNFSFTYGFDETTRRDPLIESDVQERRRGAVDYGWQRNVKYIEPFKKLIKKDKYLKFIKEINFNPLPNSISIGTDLDRRFNTTRYRFSGNDPEFNTFYNKQFLWNRRYDMQWDLTKNLKFRFNADNVGVIDEPDEKVMIRRNKLAENDPLYISNIKDYRRDSIRANLRNFGRTKNYKHQYSVTYNLPLKTLPFMDWTNVKVSYDADYSWTASSLATEAQALGNVITNGQRRQIEGDFDFEKLYNYSKYLKKINSKPKPGAGGKGADKDSKEEKDSKDSRKDKKGKGKKGKDGGDAKDTDTPNADPTKDSDGKGKDSIADKKGGKDSDKGKDKNKDSAKGKDDDKNKDRQPSIVERAIIRPLMTVRKLKVRYTEDFSTVIPGYLPDSKLFGMEKFTAPGWDFVAGAQPNINPDDYYTDKDWLYKNWQWITPDIEYALPRNINQTYEQVLDGRLELEPYSDFRVTVEAKRSKSTNHTEDFRRFDDLPGADLQQAEWRHANATDFGQFNVSYSALNTLFERDLEGLFQQFEDNKLAVARRLSDGVHDNPDSSYAEYPKGYGPFHQNVLLPAFIAAYTGQKVSDMNITDNFLGDVILNTMPRPNWRMTYSGLSKLGNLGDIFQNISITHGYQGKLVVNSFDTDRQYDPAEPTKQKETNLDYYARFEIPDIQIDEQFSPLLGIDVRFKNSMSFKTEYKKSRQLRLELIGTGRLHESKGEEFTVNFGYTLKEANLFKPKKRKKEDPKKEKKSPIGGGRQGSRASQNNPGDMIFSFDMSVKDDVTNIRELVTGLVEPNRGARRVSIAPAVQYQLSDQLSLRFFLDYNKNTPKTSQGFPTTNIRSGVTVRFTL
jgi:cell surface protein SprA